MRRVFFRDFIQQGGGLDEKEIKETLHNWRRKFGRMSRTPNAKGLRWLASTGAGLIEPTAGIILSGIDSFLNKLLPDMGPIGFIDSNYRQYIKEQEKKS